MSARRLSPRLIVALAATLTALALSRPAAAAPDPRWEVSAAASVGYASEMLALGAVVHALWTPNRYFAVGGLADVMHLSASGDLPSGAYSYALLSTYLAGVAQLRAPLGAWMPYLELGVGAVAADTLVAQRTSCDYVSGFGAHAGAGVKVLLGPNFALGVRGAARLAGGGLECLDVAGPWGFALTPLVEGSAGLHLRW